MNNHVIIAASPAQKRMYIVSHQDNIGTSYNVPMAFYVRGALDQLQLERAFNELISRHEALRTRFMLTDGELVQVIGSNLTVNPIVFDEKQISFEEAMDAFVQPFDLEVDLLIRVGLFKCANGECILMIDTHHIICDGATREIMLEELSCLYQGHSLEKPNTQYREFIERITGFLTSPAGEAQKGVLAFCV